MIRIRRNSNNL